MMHQPKVARWQSPAMTRVQTLCGTFRLRQVTRQEVATVAQPRVHHTISEKLADLAKNMANNGTNLRVVLVHAALRCTYQDMGPSTSSPHADAQWRQTAG